MKLRSYLLFAFAVLASTASGESASPGATLQSPPAETRLAKFDLDFPGGTPSELVAAIQKASGRPLNVIIPPEKADRRLPPLKMTSVDVAQLFAALTEASRQQVAHNGMQGENSWGFRTHSPSSDEAVWFFWVAELQHEKRSHFFSLTPYLQQGLTVDDITTAIQTAWKMQGKSDATTISYHKETELLIAFGDRDGVETIHRALEALRTRAPRETDVQPAAGGS